MNILENIKKILDLKKIAGDNTILKYGINFKALKIN